MRILVAEADKALAQLLVELLTEEGHRVTQVGSAEEARSLVRAGPWDAVLVDSFPAGYLAPTPVDYTLLRELSAAAPVVALTGQQWAKRLTASDLGVAALVRKPFDIQDLLRTIRALGRPHS